MDFYKLNTSTKPAPSLRNGAGIMSEAHFLFHYAHNTLTEDLTAVLTLILWISFASNWFLELNK